REHLQLRVRVGIEDMRADPTGPEGAHASGRADDHHQPWLVRCAVERTLQLADRVQVGERVRSRRGVSAGAAAAAGGDDEHGYHRSEQEFADHSLTSLRARARWRQRTSPERSAASTIAPAAATKVEPRPSAKVRMWPLKRIAKLTIGSSATVAVSPKRSRAQK